MTAFDPVEPVATKVAVAVEVPRTWANLDTATFLRLGKEGQELRRAFDKQTRGSRLLTPEDWGLRCR